MFGPVPPKTSGRRNASSNVCTPVRVAMAHTPASDDRLASHCNSFALKRGPGWPMSWMSGTSRCVAAMTVPSFGATLATKLAPTTPPAPGMFCTTNTGAPGMKRPRWRAA